MGRLFLYAILPFLLLCSMFAVEVIPRRMAAPTRGFLVAIWGSSVLPVAYATAAAAELWTNETPAQMAGKVGLDLVVGACAVPVFALGLALGWRARVEGERFLIALFRPPPGVNSRSRISGWAIAPLVLLRLALALGAFAATYGVLGHLTPAR